MKKNLKYKSELLRSMKMLSKKSNTIFLGQSVLYSGNSIFNTLVSVPKNKKIEFPVAEELQMGFSMGLAINGYLPITCYPRFDFLLLACNQMINHLDKIQYMSQKQFKPKVIIRTSVGSKKPLDGGVQHTQNYTKIFEKILTEIEVIYLDNPKTIFKTFKRCADPRIKKSFLIIENGDYYNEK